jgi:hypothetical protein
VIGDKREQVIAIAAKYGVVNLRVFGSVARGEATRDSDLDLLGEFTKPISLLGLIGLQHELEDFLERKVKVASFEELRPFAQRTAERDLVRL